MIHTVTQTTTHAVTRTMADAGLTLRPLWQRCDARWFQLVFLGCFLALGALARDFALTPWQVALTLVSALCTQAAWQWGLALP